MSLMRIKLPNNKIVEVIRIRQDGENWVTAGPFVKILRYSNNSAVKIHVSSKNQRTYRELRPAQQCAALSQIVFINKEGLIELAKACALPKAKQFRSAQIVKQM